MPKPSDKPYLREEPHDGYTIRIYKERHLTTPEGTELIPHYHGEISIICGTCGLESWNLGDVYNRYCVNCHVHHEDEAFRRRLAAEEAPR